MCRVPMPLQKSLLIILMMMRVVLPSSLMNPADVSSPAKGFSKDRIRRRHRRETRRAKTAILILLLFPEDIRESAHRVLCCGEIEYFSNVGIREEAYNKSKKKKTKTKKKRFSCNARSGNCTTTRNQSFENTWRRRAGRRGRADPKGP